MLNERWHPARIGLIDFWYYENQEFELDHGHLLLRGSNGSGKSVTMQSFIPLLLDGNKNSERLDAFGTRSRKIENYLLEEDSERTDRIGYLWMEFKRENEEVYKTIGMGLHARLNKKTDAWSGFKSCPQSSGTDAAGAEKRRWRSECDDFADGLYAAGESGAVWF